MPKACEEGDYRDLRERKRGMVRGKEVEEEMVEGMC